VTAAGTRCDSYFLAVTTVAVIDATLIGFGLLVLGVPLVLSLAVLTLLAAYAPVIGAFAAGVVAVLVAFVAGGTSDAVLVILVQQLVGNVLHPIITRRRAQLHPLTTILAVAIGGTLAGVLGALLAVPLAAMASASATSAPMTQRTT